MARPEKHDYEKRSETLRFRVTLAEKEHVLEQAAKVGQSITDYARNRTVGHVVTPSARPKFDPSTVAQLNECILELKAWGNNINQIARNLNSGRRERLGWEDAQSHTHQLAQKAESILEALVERHDT